LGALWTTGKGEEKEAENEKQGRQQGDYGGQYGRKVVTLIQLHKDSLSILSHQRLSQRRILVNENDWQIDGWDSWEVSVLSV